jgi:hypothetical protein
MHMLLADASWGGDPGAAGRHPVRVNFFARDPTALPRPRRPSGDIIRLHRARVSWVFFVCVFGWQLPLVFFLFFPSHLHFSHSSGLHVG